MGINNNKKKITVVMWDANYRENMRDGLECLKKQTAIEDLECIHVEWGTKPDPILAEYDFVKVYCLNLPLELKANIPRFDTGIQYNFGLYISQTPWVSYHQFDIMPRDFYEKILNKINLLESTNSKILYLEGWQVNGKGGDLNSRLVEYDLLKKKYKDDIDLLPYKYNGVYKKGPTINGVGITVKKLDFIKKCDGWMWNVPSRSEWYTGPGLPQKKYGNISLRNFLSKEGLGSFAQKEMVQFAIPHACSKPRSDKLKKGIHSGGIKHYSDLVSEWLPIQNITLYGEGDK